jgi:hypothetical protein
MYIKPSCTSSLFAKVADMDTDSPDQPIVEARANLSSLIASVRLLRRTYFLTSRGKRQVALVPVELGELVEQAGGPDATAEIVKAHLAGGR